MSAKLTLKTYFTWRKHVMKLLTNTENPLPPCALVLLDYLELNQGDNWLFHETKIKAETGLTAKGTFYKAKKALLDAKLVTWQGQKDGIRIRVTYDVQKSDVQKSDVQKSDVQKSDVQKSDYIERKKIQRKEENRIKEENTHKGACAASDAPAGAAASVCVSSSPSEKPLSQAEKPRQSCSKAAKASKAAEKPVSENPPSQEDITAYIFKIVSGREESPSWNEKNISGTAFDIWNHYTNNGWKTAGGSPMLCWQNTVIGWLRRNHWLPEQSQVSVPAPSPEPLPAQKTSNTAEKQQSFKQMERKWIERPLTDPEACAVEDAAHLIFNARSEGEAQGVLNSIPVHLRERALALAAEKRKEQGDKPRIISPLPYEDDDS